MQLSLKFDLRAPQWGTPPAELYAAAIDMCEWADDAGFDVVRFLEHHGSDDGYCPSPLAMAAAVAARTKRVRIRVRALVLPLHDPVRIAEDCSVIDVISRGRLELVVAGGYVRSEFEMFGKDLADRPRLVEEGIAVLKQAWTGEPFTYQGRPAQVALRPFRRPRPPIALGGSSKVAARRAARIADGFEPAGRGLFEEYEAECQRLGVQPGPRPPSMPSGQFLHVATDVESAWAALGPHLLHEMRSYGAWLAEAGTGTQYRPVADLGELRASGAYSIVTPEQCLDLARSLGAGSGLEFHPLVGGADPTIGWSCLRLVERDVLPALLEDHVASGRERERLTGRV
jgi:alkanesulfonate monooxygenase SsuD/methylene tetrahydromethanopterin reductase-like flavin-dependent oxidoreductase (luciferase family)